MNKIMWKPQDQNNDGISKINSESNLWLDEKALADSEEKIREQSEKWKRYIQEILADNSDQYLAWYIKD